MEKVAVKSRYKCKVCSHVYDPQRGDSISDIEAGVPFEELPEEWRCPICGVGKEHFAIMEQQ